MLHAKLCGMRSAEAALAAEAAGADFIGFIFCKGARRYIEPERAREIAAAVHHAKKVGVFVNEDAADVNEIADAVGLDFVQLHGDEDALYARAITRPVIKAFCYTDSFTADEADAYPAEMVLIDAYRPGVPGGTGEAFDWRRAAREIAKIEKPVLIAGGISEANVAEVQEIFHPYGVDVSSSLEVGGEKDVEKIRSFMQEVRRANGMEESPYSAGR